MNEDTYRDKLTDLQLEVEALRAKLKEAQTGDLISRAAALTALTSTAGVGNRALDKIRALPSVQSQQVTGKLNADCISRKAAIDALTEYGNGRTVYISVEEAFRRIEQLPSAHCDYCPYPDDYDGRVAVVRCKDCKYFAGEGMYCENDIIVHFDHFYCYNAERRPDGFD